MNRKPPKPEIRGAQSSNGVEYRSDPTVLAQSSWYHVFSIGTARSSKGFSLRHEDEPAFLLHYIRRGEMWHTISERTYCVKQAKACLMYLQKPVRYGNDRDEPVETWWILFGGRELPNNFLALDADQNPVFDLPDVARFEQLFDELLALTRDRPIAYQARSFGVLALILAELFVARRKGDAPQIDLLNPREDATRFSEPVLNAIRCIGRHFSEPLTPRRICQVTNLSVPHFGRLFRRETGLAPMRYLTRYRIEKAKELLKSTTHPVREVARMVGIPDPYTFARTFRKIAGKSPTEYRVVKTSEH